MQHISSVLNNQSKISPPNVLRYLKYRQLVPYEVQGNYSLTDLAEGFVHGLQRYENQTSKCSSDVQKVQGIVDQIKDIIQSIQDGKFDPNSFVLFLFQTWTTINVIEGSCHFYKLFVEIRDLIISPVALIIRVAYILFVASWQIVPDAFLAFIGLIFGDFYKAGLNMGRIVKLSLQYYIE